MGTQQPDSAFGQTMQSLRTAIALSRAGLANELGVSRQAVGAWEAGRSCPKAEHLKAVISLGVKSQAFEAGREIEEIRVLWKAACQKVPLDENWLTALLGGTRLRHLHLVPPPVEEKSEPIDIFGARETLVDWGEALEIPTFYGRAKELALLSQWIVQEHCRVVSVLGMGGIGKSALSVNAMYQLVRHFEVVVFRSLRDAPSCEALLDDCLQVLSPKLLRTVPASLEPRISELLVHLRETRVLLVLDNLECLLTAGDPRGHFSPGFLGYGQLLQRVAETGHQSCLLLTSREQPADLRVLSIRYPQVHSLHLTGLSVAECSPLLKEKGLTGTEADEMRLIEAYSGNPLALKIVAETVLDLFGGELSPFLAGDTVIFGCVTDLLDEQFARLSAIEQSVLYWLTISREPMTLDELQALLVTPMPRVLLVEAVDGLRRRSLIERGKRAGSFTLQSVVLEYVTAVLIAEASHEIKQGQLHRLIRYGLSLSSASEYVRQTQERLLLSPLLAELQCWYPIRAEMEGQLLSLLDELRGDAEDAQGYGPANLITLLRLLRGDLRELDLSYLALRSTSLQGVELQDATLSGAIIRECVWTSTFDASWAVAISRSGQYWATGSKWGEVRVWREAGQTLHLAWRAHTDIVTSIDFSPDERTLATGSGDGDLKLWEVTSGALLWTGWHTNNTSCVAFSPDGRVLASGGNDAAVRLWDPESGRQFETLPHPAAVFAVSWSPDGCLLASGGPDRHIRLWELHQSGPATCMQTLSGHSNLVRALAFAPSGSILASASWDGTVRLWEVVSGHCLHTLERHTDQVHTVAWSPDGHTVASAGFDATIWLWDAERGSYRGVLQGHTRTVYSIAFTPDSRNLLSGSEDGTVRLWEVGHGQCVRLMQGYTAPLYDVDWSPDGTRLASAGSDTVVTLWEVVGRGRGTPFRVLGSHGSPVYGVGWSPDGDRLASSGWDRTIRLWDPATGTCVQVLRDLDHPETVFCGVAWSPDGRLLADGTYLGGMLVWDVAARSLRWGDRARSTWLRRVAWSPDGTRLISGDEDGHLYVWDASDGTLLQRQRGHLGVVMSVAWSSDGSRLASGGSSQGQGGGGEVTVWDVQSWERVRVLVGHPGGVSALTWAPSGEWLISGSTDGRLRWWEAHSGECVRVQEAHQGIVQALKVSPDGSTLASCGEDGAIALWDLESGKHLRTLRRDRPYERLNITGIRGLNTAQISSLLALGAIECDSFPKP